MANRQAFGRRVQAQPRVNKRAAPVSPPAPAARDEIPRSAGEPAHAFEIAQPSVDAELEEWKRARRKNFRIPWRPLYLMASLSFGIASFVLPDSVNSDVDYLLYFLMAASFYAGIKKRREKKAAA